jgi:hypothetical protein
MLYEVCCSCSNIGLNVTVRLSFPFHHVIQQLVGVSADALDVLGSFQMHVAYAYSKIV